VTARIRGFLKVALLALLAREANANGRYPTAKHIVFDPSDPQHLVATTTFGLLESRDQGKSFEWRCEGALGVAGDQDELVAITASGTTVAALTNGLVTTADGCTYRAAPELAGQFVADLALSRSTPHALYAFTTEISSTGELDSQVVQSVDDGQSWSNVGPQLPVTLLPLTIDVAPSDAMRVYVSARTGSPDYSSVLLRSDDGGKTFPTPLPIPGTMAQRLAYIAAVHPRDANRVFFRVDDSPGTVIWSTEDGGQNFEKRFTAKGQLLGFAISPDGSTIAFGGPDDGVWVGAENAMTFEHRSNVAPSCLTWNDDGIYACADQATDPFSIGISRDMGVSFDPLLRFDALCGATECPAATAGYAQCASTWPSIAASLGAKCMDAGPAPPPPPSEDASVGSDASLMPDASPAPDASGTRDASVTSDGAAGVLDAPVQGMPDGSTVPPSPPNPSGCHCELSRAAASSKNGAFFVSLGLLLLVRRQRRRFS
jgi:hypothetical protein